MAEGGELIRLCPGLRMERRRLVLPWDYLSAEMKRWLLRAIGHELPEGGNVLKPRGQSVNLPTWKCRITMVTVTRRISDAVREAGSVVEPAGRDTAVRVWG